MIDDGSSKSEFRDLQSGKQILGGHSLAHAEGRTHMLFGACPGETVRAKLQHKRKGIWWADVQEVIGQPSAERVTALCEYFGKCGGCSYQHINYSAQLKIKEDILREMFSSTGLPLGDTIAANQAMAYRYRNKCEFTFGTDRGSTYLKLGMHPARKFFEVLDLADCHLMPTPIVKVVESVRDFAQNSGLQAYRDLTGEGFWQTLTVRHSLQQDEIIVIIRVSDPSHSTMSDLVDDLRTKHSNLAGVLLARSPRESAVLLWGRSTLLEEFDDVKLIYDGRGFFQVNMHVLPAVLRRIAELVDLTGAGIAYDLFGGVGTLGLYCAAHCKGLAAVVGAESDGQAVELARFNAELNAIEHYEAHCIDLYRKGWGTMLKRSNPEDQAACAIIDPPRAGLSPKTIKELLALNPASLVYMSCNPATQQRDIAGLSANGYILKSLQLVDMFPQTKHLESLALLKRAE